MEKSIKVYIGTGFCIAAGFISGVLSENVKCSLELYDRGIRYSVNKDVRATTAIAEVLRNDYGLPDKCADLALRVGDKKLALACTKDLLDNESEIDTKKAVPFLRRLYPELVVENAVDAAKSEAKQ